MPRVSLTPLLPALGLFARICASLHRCPQAFVVPRQASAAAGRKPAQGRPHAHGGGGGGELDGRDGGAHDARRGGGGGGAARGYSPGLLPSAESAAGAVAPTQLPSTLSLLLPWESVAHALPGALGGMLPRGADAHGAGGSGGSGNGGNGGALAGTYAQVSCIVTNVTHFAAPLASSAQAHAQQADVRVSSGLPNTGRCARGLRSLGRRPAWRASLRSASRRSAHGALPVAPALCTRRRRADYNGHYRATYRALPSAASAHAEGSNSL